MLQLLYTAKPSLHEALVTPSPSESLMMQLRIASLLLNKNGMQIPLSILALIRQGQSMLLLKVRRDTQSMH